MGKDYYIYIFLDQRFTGEWKYGELKFNFKPFYIGKGKNGRITDHFSNSSLNSNSYKNNLIKKIKEELNELPIHYRIFENLTEDEAFKIEIDIIAHFGRVKNGGLLVNLTEGGEGHSGYNEPKSSKWRKVYQYNLNGEFVKKWESLVSLKALFKSPANVSTSIKRGGTYGGYIWSYEYKEIIDPKIKYQMPIKFNQIEQIDINTDKIIKVFEDALSIEKELNLRRGARNKIYECLNNKLKTAYGYKWKIRK